MRRLRDELPTLAGLKIETVPAGAKYTRVRETFGPDFYISGGWIEQGSLRCHVLGNVPAQGFCGSGLVDAVAAGLELDIIAPAGHLSKGMNPWTVCPPVVLTQSDVRELQLAKGAIAAGIKMLSREIGATEIARVYLAGAFGNYVNRASAQRIGMLDFPPELIKPAGNTALLGAKMSLFELDKDGLSYTAIRKRIRHVALNLDPDFQDVFVEQMAFPSKAPSQTGTETAGVSLP